ncbi:hypothetical protein, partial [Tardiphaga sp.]|uniref:hypothetical protein n=1 Tax=Tardiphaga sp. TaxID=1926292 RepID=UPI00262BB88A
RPGLLPAVGKFFAKGFCRGRRARMNSGQIVLFRLFSVESFGKCAPQHERRFLDTSLELSD